MLPPVASINPKINPDAVSEAGGELEAVTLGGANRPVIETHAPVSRLEGTIIDNTTQAKRQAIAAIAEERHEQDEAALEALWEATVDRSPVLRYSLEKLNTPVDLQQKHASRFVVKSLNMLLSGAAMASMFMPGASGGYRQLGTMAGRDLLNNVRFNPEAQVTLTPTEQIQLAALVDTLKADVIRNYFAYKNTLALLAEAHQQAAENNADYAAALAGYKKGKTTPSELLMAADAHHRAALYEQGLRQQAKESRLNLERLAGKEVMETHVVAERLLAVPELAAAPAKDKADASKRSRTSVKASVSRKSEPVTWQAEPVQAPPAVGPELPPLELMEDAY